jgi:hypothetical protein
MNKRIPSDVGTIVGGIIYIAILICWPDWKPHFAQKLAALFPGFDSSFYQFVVFFILLLGGGRLVGYFAGRLVSFILSKRHDQAA